MVYVRSRKFCCCLPVRFGVFVESLLGLGVGGFFAIAGILQVRQFDKTIIVDQQTKTSTWIMLVSFGIFALVSLFGFIGAIGKFRTLVAIYATSLVAVTVANIAVGSYYIFSLFRDHDALLAKCLQDVGALGQSDNLKELECEAGLRISRTVIIVVYVLFWLFEIYGCFIATNYVGQLSEERSANDTEKQIGAPNVTIVNAAPPTQGPYAFSTQKNSYGGQV